MAREPFQSIEQRPVPHDDLHVADELVAESRVLDAIDMLSRTNRQHPDAAVEYRLAELRHTAFAALDPSPGYPAWPPSVPPRRSASPTIPELDSDDLTSDMVREAILRHGCVLVRELVGPQEVALLVDGIDRAFDTWASLRRPFARATGSPWFDPLPVDQPSQESLKRTWVTDGAGILTVDSPRPLFLLLEVFGMLGLHELAFEYLGERPALSANKCTLRRVPVDTNAGWHQDGSFLGPDIRALNVWLSLSHCGADAPGLDILPQRFDEIVETGSHGSYFDWAVGPELVEALARETPIARPTFGPGDVLFFDDMLLHRTATDPSMSRARYAIETWCFAPSHYPEGHVPLVW